VNNFPVKSLFPLVDFLSEANCGTLRVASILKGAQKNFFSCGIISEP
jgi:hypothetical protein